MEFSKRVKEERERLNFTQEELAEKAGISLPLLQKMEYGTRFGSKATHEKLAKALNISVASLVYEAKEPDETKGKLLYWLDFDGNLSPSAKRAIKNIINEEYEERRRNANPPIQGTNTSPKKSNNPD